VLVRRVEKHILKESNKYFDMLTEFCHNSKNLYNHANHIIRQEFISNNRWIRYNELNEILKNDKEFPDYYNMPLVQSAQQTLKLLDTNWKSFFKAIKDWKKNPDKYLGRPKVPKYLKKNDNYILMLTNQNCKLKSDSILYFPKIFNGFTIKPNFINRSDYHSFQQVRIIPHKHRIVIELVYNIEIKDKEITDYNRFISIDIGINNLTTVANNVNLPAFIINGKPLKSVNQFYNKQTAHYKSICDRVNNIKYSNRMYRITDKRDSKIIDYLHKASRYIINWCLTNNIDAIIIGQNKGWKQKVNLKSQTNQNFTQIPFAKFIQMIQYKAEEQGIAVILTEESYTSGTSFIDNEEPTKEFYDKSRRKYRGMFKSNNGVLINADLNGAYQIMKKVVPIKWNRDCALQPFVVNIA
jgi:putative transposase